MNYTPIYNCTTADFDRLAILNKMLCIAKEQGARIPQYSPICLKNRELADYIQYIPEWLTSSSQIFSRPDMIEVKNFDKAMSSLKLFRKEVENNIPRIMAMQNHLIREVHLPTVIEHINTGESGRIHPYACTVEFVYQNRYYKFTSSHIDAMFNLNRDQTFMQPEFQPKDLLIPKWARSVYVATLNQDGSVPLAQTEYISYDADTDFKWDIYDIPADSEHTFTEIGKQAAADRENMYLTAAHRLFNRLTALPDTITVSKLKF